ncbi:MAG: hypothetical protein JSS72_04705 [Armatimonadetes bacterium]|nr:hypothetical protein [Armatimonadota bacterium]
MAGLESELVRHALMTARDRSYYRVELEVGEGVFSATLEPQKKPAKSPLAAISKESTAADGNLMIKARHVGYFQSGKEPLKVGQFVGPQDVVGRVQTLGIENDVEAGVEGEVIEILVKDGDPVEFGQVVAFVKAGA